MPRKAVIQSIGHRLPTRILTNDDLSKFVDTNDEWIFQRTGIRQRHVLEGEETASWLAIGAAEQALERSGLSRDEIEVVICATVSGDYLWPSTSTQVQDALGLRNAAAFDVSAACAGFIYALCTGNALINSGEMSNALVIGMDALSKQVDWKDRATCVLFGDAAGAVVMKAEDTTDRGLIATVLFSDGSGGQHIWIEAGGTRHPFPTAGEQGHTYAIQMHGAEVFRFAVHAMGEACVKVLEKAGMTSDQVDLFVPHQANSRIIESAAKRLNLPSEKVFVNVHKYGNTSGGSVPLALYEAQAEGRLKKGMTVMTVGFGAGLVWGANIIRW
jgi:3-oxoacyl-[acyl-carrier-protein] synthase-3